MSEHSGAAPDRGERWILFVFLACLGYSIWALSVGWNNSLLGLHAFRQTQTAMAVEYLLDGSDWIRYETPMLGVPWSIPFEFPLFQWIVAAICRLLDTPIAQTARFVSIGFFLATIAPLVSLQGSLGIRGTRRLILPSLLLVSPIYIFWSRAVMIESTALFLCTASLAMLAAYLGEEGSPRMRLLLAASLCGILAALVKITTLLPFLMAGLALTFAARPRGHGRASRTQVVLVLGVLVPFLVGLTWTRFADAERQLNPLAHEFLTGSTMRKWFLGSVSDRLEWTAWWTTLNRTVQHTTGNWGVVLGALFLLPVLPKRNRAGFWACVGLFLTAPSLLMHLHRTHEYYPYANAVFLLGATATSIVGSLDSTVTARRLAVCLFGLALLSSLAEYRRFYYRAQTMDVRIDPGLVEATERTIPPNGVLMIYGSYWSPEIPYYLKRRAILNWNNQELESVPMRAALEGLQRADYQIEGVIACHAARADSSRLIRAVENLGMTAAPSYVGPDCDLYGAAR